MGRSVSGTDTGARGARGSLPRGGRARSPSGTASAGQGPSRDARSPRRSPPPQSCQPNGASRLRRPLGAGGAALWHHQRCACSRVTWWGRPLPLSAGGAVPEVASAAVPSCPVPSRSSEPARGSPYCSAGVSAGAVGERVVGARLPPCGVWGSSAGGAAASSGPTECPCEDFLHRMFLFACRFS